MFVSLCACNFVHPTTSFPLHPSTALPWSCLPFACSVPSTLYPTPLPFSPFRLHEKILILMTMRLSLSLFFCLFATQQWCGGLSYMPHGCSLLIGGLSRHIHTRNGTRFCTHILSRAGDRGLDCVCLVLLPSPLPPASTSSHGPFAHLHAGYTVMLQPHLLLAIAAVFFFLSLLFFPKCCGVSQFMGLVCWRAFWGRRPHEEVGR